MKAIRLLAAVLAVALCTFCAQAAPPKEKPAESSTVAGKIGDKVFTLEEVDRQVMKTDTQIFQQLYQARRDALDALVAEFLIDKEAKTRGITKDDLLKAEVTDKVQPVADADILAFYDQNKARMQNQTLETVKPRIQTFLAQQRSAEANEAFLARLKKDVPIKVVLDAPRVEVTVSPDDPAFGLATAPVTIVEFSDYQCPYSGRNAPNMKKVRDEYGTKIRHVYKDFPLNFHQNANAAAQAARCAGDQGKYWEYQAKLFANQAKLSADDLKQTATDTGLDAAKFNQCLDSGKYKQVVDRNLKEGEGLGVRGTPAMFINGRVVSGAQPFEAIKLIIDEELERKGVALPAAAAPETPKTP